MTDISQDEKRELIKLIEDNEDADVLLALLEAKVQHLGKTHTLPPELKDAGDVKVESFNLRKFVHYQVTLGNSVEHAKTSQHLFNILSAQARVLKASLKVWSRPKTQLWTTLPIPVSVLTDSYKASHFLMYPEAKRMVAYGEFRGPYEKDQKDTRFVFYGMRYIVENFISRQWTVQDVEQADKFYKTHNVGFQPFPFPKDLFLKFVTDHKGYFPVKIQTLPEGTVANVRVPVYQIWAEKEFARLVTFLETILTQVWYPTTVATLSRRVKDVVAAAFAKSVDDEMSFLVDSRLHDFGFRGCTCVEQSVLGGTAHLLNFTGSDTMSACYYAQFNMNGGKPVASSLPATEHSVMTSWPTEQLAIRNMIKEFGGPGRVFACVMDSYDYKNALEKVIPSLAEEHKKKGGIMVLRPDSGDPVECIRQALVAGEASFGATVNKKGFKVLNGVAAIQGDGINHVTVGEILKMTLELGFSAQNVAFGMGGGLLQKVNRDTMSFATKLSYIEYGDGKVREVMKKPATDGGKISFPGILEVRRVEGKLTVFPSKVDAKIGSENMLKVVYDHGPVPGAYSEDFDAIKARVQKEWSECPKVHDVISAELQAKIDAWGVEHSENYKKMLASLSK